MSASVLFVCLGNICRSPTAEAIFRAQAASRELTVTTDSAGTGNWHIGDPPDARAQAEARRRGLDLSGLRARQFKVGDFSDFDLIVAMDADNLRNIEAQRPPGSDTPVKLMCDFAPDQPLTDVPDPYFESGFDGVFDLIELASGGLIDQLQSDRR